MNIHIKRAIEKVKSYLSRLSFRTGVIVLFSCIPFYAISFLMLLLPVSEVLRGALWALFFGLAKSAQYGGLTILGVEGVKRVKSWFNRSKKEPC